MVIKVVRKIYPPTVIRVVSKTNNNGSQKKIGEKINWTKAVKSEEVREDKCHKIMWAPMEKTTFSSEKEPPLIGGMIGDCFLKHL